jgi:enoyl-CoA hydratase/carnithine racemase
VQLREVVYAVEDGIATVTLDRPSRLNAFTKHMQVELCQVFDEIDGDPAVRAVVVTGAGRGFCAGADLGGGEATFDTDNAPAEAGMEREADGRHRDEGGLVTLRIFRLTKPVIAAINGPSVGVGATMTLPMDVRLASTSARFGFVFARRGIVPEACSSWFLPRVVGISRAMEWCATGRVFGADEALAGGLVRSVHEPDELLPAAYALAREIADSTSGVSVAVTRALLWRMLGAPHPMEAHRLDSAFIDELGAGPEAREGVMSFLEKRAPNFPGRVPVDLPSPYPWWSEPDF